MKTPFHDQRCLAFLAHCFGLKSSLMTLEICRSLQSLGGAHQTPGFIGWLEAALGRAKRGTHAVSGKTALSCTASCAFSRCFDVNDINSHYLCFPRSVSSFSLSTLAPSALSLCLSLDLWPVTTSWPGIADVKLRLQSRWSVSSCSWQEIVVVFPCL